MFKNKKGESMKIPKSSKFGQKAISIIMVSLMLVLSVLPNGISVKASDDVKKYPFNPSEYETGYKAYKALVGDKHDQTIIYTSVDGKYLYIPRRSNKSSPTASVTYKTVGWTIVVQQGSKKLTFDVSKSEKLIKSQYGDESAVNGYYYEIHRIKVQDLEDKIMAVAKEEKGKSAASYIASIMGSEYDIHMYPIIKPSNKDKKYRLISNDDKKAFLNCAGWSEKTEDTMDRWHKGWSGKMVSKSYQITYNMNGFSFNSDGTFSVSKEPTELAKALGDTTTATKYKPTLNSENRILDKKNAYPVIQIDSPIISGITTASVNGVNKTGYHTDVKSLSWNTQKDDSGNIVT